MSSPDLSLLDIPLLGMDEMPLGKDFFEKLLESLYDGLYFVDANRRILYWNRGAELLTGYKQEDVVGS